MDLVGEGLHDISEEGCPFHFSGAIVEIDIGELRDAIDSQEHHQFAVGVAQLAAVNMDVADLVRSYGGNWVMTV